MLHNTFQSKCCLKVSWKTAFLSKAKKVSSTISEKALSSQIAHIKLSMVNNVTRHDEMLCRLVSRGCQRTPIIWLLMYT